MRRQAEQLSIGPPTRMSGRAASNGSSGGSLITVQLAEWSTLNAKMVSTLLTASRGPLSLLLLPLLRVRFVVPRLVGGVWFTPE
jgi:hypothetical protein